MAKDLAQALLIVHPDWPWVYEPEWMCKDTMKQAEVALANIHKEVLAFQKEKKPIHVFATPSKYRKRKLPKRFRIIIQDIEHAAHSILATADFLEENAECLAKKIGKAQWTIAGFWEDLCCCDCAFGIKQATKKKPLRPKHLTVESKLREEIKCS